MLAIYKLVYRIFFSEFFLYIKTCILNHLIQYIKWFVLVLTQATMHSSENLPYIDLDSILLTVQMSLPINYLRYMKLVQLYREQH